VLEGDLNTVKQGLQNLLTLMISNCFILVHEAVVRNNIPVVLLEGTGKCCDLFAKAYHLYNEYDQKLEKSHRKNKIREKLQNMLNEANSTNQSEDYFELIYECIEKRQIFLNFVDFKEHSQVEPDVDLAILQALLIGKIK
jgi:hypothetical protein